MHLIIKRKKKKKKINIDLEKWAIHDKKHSLSQSKGVLNSLTQYPL